MDKVLCMRYWAGVVQNVNPSVGPDPKIVSLKTLKHSAGTWERDDHCVFVRVRKNHGMWNWVRNWLLGRRFERLWYGEPKMVGTRYWKGLADVLQFDLIVKLLMWRQLFRCICVLRMQILVAYLIGRESLKKICIWIFRVVTNSAIDCVEHLNQIVAKRSIFMWYCTRSKSLKRIIIPTMVFAIKSIKLVP